MCLPCGSGSRESATAVSVGVELVSPTMACKRLEGFFLGILASLKVKLSVCDPDFHVFAEQLGLFPKQLKVTFISTLL